VGAAGSVNMEPSAAADKDCNRHAAWTQPARWSRAISSISRNVSTR
jgi:hypothetical protein